MWDRREEHWRLRLPGAVLWWVGHLGLCCVSLHRVCQAPRVRREKQEMWALW